MLLLAVGCDGKPKSQSGKDAGVTNPPPSVVVTSHANDQVIHGSRVLTVAGTLGDVPPSSTVTAKHNNTDVAVTFDTASFSVPLTLGDNVNTIELTATTPDGQTGQASLVLEYPYLRLTNFQPASMVIGAADFATDTPLVPPTAASTSTMRGEPDYGGVALYVPDSGNNRVLGFNYIPTANGASADFVLGQADFVTSAAATTSATSLKAPQSVQVHDGKLFVTDTENHRILVWDAAPTATQAPASFAIGQADLTTSSFACSATGLHNPEAIFLRGTKLIVGDTSNHRILIWNTIPTTSGTPPDVVVGQSSLTQCTANDDNQDGAGDAAPTARTLVGPGDIWTDETRLVVVDSGNNRVLIWNQFPTANFQPADIVIGQPGMTTGAAAQTASAFQFPYFVESNGNQLFVADKDNNRVVIWNEFPTANGEAADAVLGQSNFTNSNSDDDDQDNLADADPSARTMERVRGVRIIDGSLWVTDGHNSRYLVFRP